jgi:sigma-B regulation protein RsbU (phosphoserine phosphatase)
VANAGHQPPLLRFPDGRVEVIEVERVGVPLNVSTSPGSSPLTSTIDLPPGATVLAYTDGLSEADNAAGDMFGEQRIRELFERSDGDPVRFGERLVAEVSAFAAGRRQRDDTTLVCFGRTAH